MQGFAEEDFLVVQQRSGLLKPSYFLLRDQAISAIVLLIRGTQTVKVASARGLPNHDSAPASSPLLQDSLQRFRHSA